jgi:hypothetical protein
MKKFTQAYDAARKAIITNKKYEAEWQTLLTQKIAPILDEAGPKQSQASGLDELRTQLTAKSGTRTTGTAEEKLANTIYDASVNTTDTTGLLERVAALKMMKHLYLAEKSGAQNVWVYAPPKAYSKWVFDEIVGEKSAVITKLKEETEVYSATQRGVMCSALHQSRKVVLDAVAKLGTPVDATKTVFKRWFGSDTEADMTSMADSFKKIGAALGSTTMVFSDEPLDRQTAWKDWGFVYATKERFPVVYVQKAFLDAAGNSGELWRCGLTLIHELSHYVLDTEDYRYDNGVPGDLAGVGLTPDVTFTSAKAMDNADSLAYFCVDLAGFLSGSDRTSALAGTL